MNTHCLFIDIIGSMPDENENTDKIGGYYQVTNSILIKDLVIKLLNMKKEQIKIFAYGDKLFYDPYIHTNNKYYHQFGLHDIFQMTADPHDLEFKYFFDFKKTLQDIDKIIKKGKYTSIILFLDDHGSKGKFSNMNYFQLYQIFLKYPEINFLVFNDSCFSGSLINLIETYKKIYELKIENKINDEICLQLVFSFTNLFKSIMKKKNINDPINEVKNLIEFYQTNEITDQNKFKDLLNVIKSNSNSIDRIKKIGFQSTEEITNFQIIYHSLHLKENLEEDTDAEFIKYTKSREVFTTTNLNLIINLFNDDLQEFVNVIDILDACKENINFQYQPSQNVEIITSTDDKSRCFSYTSIRTNNVTKVFPGSPAMSEFIKGIFLTYDKSIINFDTIKKAMCGTDENTIYYSVRVREKSSKGHIKKEWANLFPQHYKSNDTNSYSLKIPEKSGQKIAALRAISFIISNKSTEIAKKLSPDLDPKVHNIINDPIADMIAIAAIINENSNMKEIINNSINENQFYKEHEIFGFDLISPIIEFASYSSRDKLQMIAVMMNCLSAAIIKEINQCIKSIEENDELKIPILKFILKNEISYFQSNLNEINNVNNDKDNHSNKSKIIKEYNKIEVINEVKNAIFALLQPSSIFFVYIIASSLLDDINIEGIKQSDFITSSSKMNKYYKQFIEKKNLNQLKEIKFRKLAEHWLFNHVKLSLDSLNDICDMHIKNDIMKVVVRGIQSQNSIFLVKIL